MRFERRFVNKNGSEFRAVVEIDESGPRLERAIAHLANKARAAARQEARTLGGAVRVIVHPIIVKE